ncbi:hypothetical protein AK812_SmicGene4629 [Symbiodinium microadriaticum]|uniref:Uncharacterized protein n=1 Tax=Symbiodinium microadriaticum TaxID=2951 RepID=A0A1Q9EVW9_SYMMI|nr:hypothetical protein AK812_SmicGene4629 [Symbiodinium microadriaticum]
MAKEEVQVWRPAELAAARITGAETGQRAVPGRGATGHEWCNAATEWLGGLPEAGAAVVGGMDVSRACVYLAEVASEIQMITDAAEVDAKYELWRAKMAEKDQVIKKLAAKLKELTESPGPKVDAGGADGIPSRLTERPDAGEGCIMSTEDLINGRGSPPEEAPWYLCHNSPPPWASLPPEHPPLPQTRNSAHWRPQQPVRLFLVILLVIIIIIIIIIIMLDIGTTMVTVITVVVIDVVVVDAWASSLRSPTVVAPSGAGFMLAISRASSSRKTQRPREAAERVQILWVPAPGDRAAQVRAGDAQVDQLSSVVKELQEVQRSRVNWKDSLPSGSRRGLVALARL